MTKNNKIVKKICMAVLVLLFLMMSIQWVNAYFYNITYKCKGNICIEGQQAEWYVTISNFGSRVMEYTAIELLDAVNGSIFVKLERPFHPQSSIRGSLIVVSQNEKVTVNLSGTVPRANYQQNLIYYPCFTKTVTDSYIISRYGEYETRNCYKENLTMPVIQCISDDNCDSDEYCGLSNCLQLDCGECQYIEDNACVNYECCSSEQCGFNEVCKNNACEKLNCKFNEYIENRTCKALNCGFDEYMANQSCKKLNCSYSEFVFNHTCKKLECQENEFIEEHECKPCKADEYAMDYTCRPLKCLYNETPVNHTCIPLNCYFFQKAENHVCINAKSVIFKLILEIAAIIAIIIFLILDVRKYEIRHKKLEKVNKR